jgi:hypothetical protein
VKNTKLFISPYLHCSLADEFPPRLSLCLLSKNVQSIRQLRSNQMNINRWRHTLSEHIFYCRANFLGVFIINNSHIEFVIEWITMIWETRKNTKLKMFVFQIKHWIRLWLQEDSLNCSSWKYGAISWKINRVGVLPVATHAIA